jgi:uncharacterized delta-60 repeat protein
MLISEAVSRVVGLKRALIGCAVLFAITAGAALAADPTDRTFGTNGIAEVEARVAETGQVGGIADLESGGDGKLLAAVYPIARGGHYFAATRIRPNGRLDQSFGRDGFTPRVRSGRGEVKGGGVLQAEAVAGQADGKVVLAGYRDNEGAFAPALARFTAKGRLDPSFGNDGKVLPRPVRGGRRIDGNGGGERLHDVAIEPNGTIVGAGDIVSRPHGLPINGPSRARAVVVAYRPDGKIDRGFGHDGRFTITPPRSDAYTGFTAVKSLPSGKLLVSGYLRQQLVLYQLTADGKIDRSFGRDGRVTVGGLSEFSVFSRGAYLRAPVGVDRHGGIVLCGLLFPNRGKSGEEPVAFLRLSSNGRRDLSFGRSLYMERAPVDAQEPDPRKHGVQGFSFEPQAIAIDGHGRALVSGGESAPYTRGQKEPGHEDFTSRRFLPNGRRDRSFGEGGVWHTAPPGSQGLARAAVTQPDGQVVAGGWVQIERFGGNGPGNTAMMLTRYH